MSRCRRAAMSRGVPSAARAGRRTRRPHRTTRSRHPPRAAHRPQAQPQQLRQSGSSSACASETSSPKASSAHERSASPAPAGTLQSSARVCAEADGAAGIRFT
eukprot:653095-Prymnesium_polylepis.3